MIVAQPKSLPTMFARKVAAKVDLYVKPEEETGNEELWMELNTKLADFQKLALTTGFDRAMISYWGMDLDEEQKEHLKIIYDTTKDWIMGHLVGEMLNVLEGRVPQDKIVAAQAIIDNFQGSGLLGDDPGGQRRKGLLVKFAEKIG